MEDKLLAIKAATVAFFTALGAFLGWQGILAIIWVLAMAADYISGTIAAIKMGAWSSKVARDGALHKMGMLFVVIVAGMVDITLSTACVYLPIGTEWPVLILPLVFVWYILTELGSILENAVKMGAPIPEWLMDLLKAGLKVINAKVEELPGSTEDTESE